MDHVTMGNIVAALTGMVALTGGGGMIGWVLAYYRMKSEMVPRKECESMRGTCSAALWDRIDRVNAKLDDHGNTLTEIKVALAKLGNNRDA